MCFKYKLNTLAKFVWILKAMSCFYPEATFVVVKVADVYYIDVRFVVYNSEKLIKYSKVENCDNTKFQPTKIKRERKKDKQFYKVPFFPLSFFLYKQAGQFKHLFCQTNCCRERRTSQFKHLFCQIN